jgi:malate synthase
MDIPSYLDFLPETLLSRLDALSEPVPAVPGLKVAAGLRASFPKLESDEALAFVADVYDEVRDHLNTVLEQRKKDRHFIDEQTERFVDENARLEFHSPNYRTVLGLRDKAGRVVVGPSGETCHPPKVLIPKGFEGTQVTLFGPPDSVKLSINAMNAIHRRLPDEPQIIADLVERCGDAPRWGADNEDSKTPIMRNFLHACENLIGCYDGTIELDDPRNGKHYELENDRLSIPIKRFPGIAIPDGNHLLRGNPLPLHLYDFVMHMFHNRTRAESLTFYVPKLENEEEAAYIKHLIDVTERRIKEINPDYILDSVRLFIVFENPRAIFRIKEIVQALSPNFLGGSLGWHDFLASTARIFRNDPRYRIPVKADPNIVINHIRESHRILVESLAECGGITIGGMYGVLYEDGNPASYEVSMVGYIKDVVTQLKRGLQGFWVAHPDFVRVGMALTQAWKEQQTAGKTSKILSETIISLVPNPAEHTRLIEFAFGPDVPGLDHDDPLYPRAVLAATLEKSDVISNDDPREVRYNVFQALQYITDWLCGNGCVALPAAMTNADGESVFVRVMDDLATTERSRWELWAEIAHGRVSIERFDHILSEELAFLKSNTDSETKRIQVRWQGDAAIWYPIAAKILRNLVVTDEPVEFATQLLLPFTFDHVRNRHLGV